MAGHPDGQGQLYVAKRAESTEYVLSYDGEWVQVRLGRAVLHFCALSIMAKPGADTVGRVTSLAAATDADANALAMGCAENKHNNKSVMPWPSHHNLLAVMQGNRQGQGRQHYTSGEVYTGAFVNNMRQGFGRMEYANGDVYEGFWEADRRDGAGRLLDKGGDVVFEGSFINGVREGQGCLLRISKVRVVDVVPLHSVVPSGSALLGVMLFA